MTSLEKCDVCGFTKEGELGSIMYSPRNKSTEQIDVCNNCISYVKSTINNKAMKMRDDL